MQEPQETTKTESTGKQAEARKLYRKPEIIHELELEARAGSPLHVDPFSLEDGN